MKRTVSLLIAMVLILAVFPASSAMAGQEDCQHFINQSKTYKEYRVLDAYSHQVETWSAFYCYYCNVFFRDMGETLVASEEQWHSFNSKGKCTQCGYVKTCSHSKTNTYYLYVEYTPIAGNDKQHNHINHDKVTCADCGEVVNADETTHLRSSHSFNSSNKCTQCGYQKSSVCKHAKTKPEKIRTEYEKLEGNDNQHRVINHIKTTCSDCGYVVSADEEQYQVAAHSYNNGKCMDCGYQKDACTHANTSKKYVTDAKYSKIDGTQHTKSRNYNLVCSKCGKVIKENETEETFEDHYFSNKGTCNRCGYYDSTKCKHLQYDDTAVIDTVYQDVGEADVHERHDTVLRICKTCGVEIDEIVKKTEEQHMPDTDNMCMLCGAGDVEPAGAPRLNKYVEELNSDSDEVYFSFQFETKPSYILLEYVFYSQDEKTVLGSHSEVVKVVSALFGVVSGYRYTIGSSNYSDGSINNFTSPITKMYVTVCDENGKPLSPRSKAMVIKRTDLKVHPTLSGFSVTPTTVTLGDSITITGTINGNGKKLTAVSVGVRNYSDQSLGGYWDHRATPNADTFDLSSIGALVLGGNLGNTDFETGQWIVEVYATTEDGLGFEQSHSQIITINKPVCKHENAQPVATGDVVYSNQTETHHDAQYGYTLVCPTCNEPVDTGYGEAAPEVHDFNQGNTCVCGYEKPVCQHLVKEAEYISTVSLTDNGDGKTHTHVYNAHLTCKNCGEYLGKDKVTEDAEAHRLESKYTYGKDDNGHWKMWKTVCGCGYVASVTDESEQGKVEAHTPDENGKCTVCGYQAAIEKVGTQERLVELARAVYSDDGELNAELGQLPSDRTAWMYEGAKSLGSFGFGLMKRGYDATTDKAYIETAKASVLNSLVTSGSNEIVDEFMDALRENQGDVLDTVKVTNAQIKIVEKAGSLVVDFLENGEWVKLPMAKGMLKYISKAMALSENFRTAMANGQYREDEIYTIAMLCANYEANRKYLSGCIDEASGTLEKVYQAAFDDLDATYAAIIDNKLEEFASDEGGAAMIDFDLFLDMMDTGMKVSNWSPAKDALLYASIRQAAYQTALENASAGAAGSTVAHSAETAAAYAEKAFKTLMWTYTLTSVVADYPLQGKDMYSALDEIYNCIAIIDDMCAELDSAIAVYSAEPNDENRMALVSKTVALANVRIQSLNACIKYEESRVLVKLEDAIGGLIWEDTTGWIESRCSALNQNIQKLEGIIGEVESYK